MTESNRVRLTYVAESTAGTTPNTPTMRTIRATGESLNRNISTVISNEIRSDRMIPDILQVAGENSGDLNFEFSYPAERTMFSEFLEAAFYSTWTKTASKYNATSDSELANVGSGTGVYTVDAGGTSFVAGHLVSASGFTNSANNGLFTVTSSTGTTVTTNNSSSVAETAPPAGARFKVVGFIGGSGDIATVTSGGNRITSSSLDFTTLGLVAGQWLKLGGTASGDKFATSACNGFARIVSVAANAVYLDNVPTGFAADSGTGKTIKVWVADYLRQGTTSKYFSIEKGFLGQAVPNYLVYTGCYVSQMALSVASQQIVTGSFSIMGMGHSTSTSSLGSPEAASTESILTASANAGRLSENGSQLSSPNFARSISLQLNNNLRGVDEIGNSGLAGINSGRAELTGQMQVYFGNADIYNRYVNGTASSVNFRLFAGSRAFVFDIPNLKFTNAQVVASGINTDVVAQIDFAAKYDSTLGIQFQAGRFDYYEA